MAFYHRRRRGSRTTVIVTVLTLCFGGLHYASRHHLLPDWPAAQPSHSQTQSRPSSQTDTQAHGTASSTENTAIVFGGLPVNVSDACHLQILSNQVYTVGYCPTDHGPHWSAYHIAPVKRLVNQPRAETFYPDHRVPDPISTQTYNHSGYDRGHMTPHYAIATRFPDQAHSTFLLSNILPQRPELNRGLWADLESIIARKYGQAGDVWVIIGPIYDQRPAQTLTGLVSVPTRFFHIIYTNTDGGIKALAFIFPQKPEPGSHLDDYLSSIERIEHLTGLSFAPDLPVEARNQLAHYEAQHLW